MQRDPLAPTSSVTTGVSLFGVDEYHGHHRPGGRLHPDGRQLFHSQLNTNTGAGTDDWFWEVGDVDVTYGIPRQPLPFEYPPVTWNIDEVNSFALQLNGTVVPVELQSISVE